MAWASLVLKSSSSLCSIRLLPIVCVAVFVGLLAVQCSPGMAINGMDANEV